jgi:hypothetical protein
MRGHRLVCDRFVVDILADLMAGLDDPGFDERMPGRLFLALLPRDTRVIILDLDTSIAQQRCPELRGDRSHTQRRAIYLDVARRRNFPVVSNEASVQTTSARVMEMIGCQVSPEHSVGQGVGMKLTQSPVSDEEI